MPVALPLPAVLGIGAYITWRVASRLRRLVGRQTLRPVRAWLAATLFPLLAVLLLGGAARQPWFAAVELAGLAIGVGLAVYGLRLTTFEDAPDGSLSYTPNAHIGIALSALMAGRLLVRLWQMTGSDGRVDPQAFASSPATLLIFGTLAGYYAAYAIGLLRRRGLRLPA